MPRKFLDVADNSITKECARSFLCSKSAKATQVDDDQITHLVCVRLKHLLYDFFRGVLGLLYKKQQEGGPKHPPKSLLANVLGGYRLDE